MHQGASISFVWFGDSFGGGKSGAGRGTRGLRFLRIYGRKCVLRPAPARMMKAFIRSVGRALLSHGVGIARWGGWGRGAHSGP